VGTAKSLSAGADNRSVFHGISCSLRGCFENLHVASRRRETHAKGCPNSGDNREYPGRQTFGRSEARSDPIELVLRQDILSVRNVLSQPSATFMGRVFRLILCKPHSTRGHLISVDNDRVFLIHFEQESHSHRVSRVKLVGFRAALYQKYDKVGLFLIVGLAVFIAERSLQEGEWIAEDTGSRPIACCNDTRTAP